MPHPERGEVWLVDLGMVAKMRPCLVLSIRADDAQDRVLSTLVPHTTSVRASRFEVPITVRFLKKGAFDAQGLVTVPQVKLVRRLGTLDDVQVTSVVEKVCLWLGIESHPAS